MRAEIPSPYNQNSTLINSLYGSIRAVRTKYPDLDDPARQETVRAYDKTVFPLFLAPLFLSIGSLITEMMMPNCYLGKIHNTVDETDTVGRVQEDDGLGGWRGKGGPKRMRRVGHGGRRRWSLLLERVKDDDI